MTEHMGIPEESMVYNADKYGYTGSASPFYALYDARKNSEIGQDDSIVFCAMASGYQVTAVLYKC